MNNPCHGRHKLIEIVKKSYNRGEEHIVRWCIYCGAIVIDTDIDNRTLPGNIMEMCIPKWVQEKYNAELSARKKNSTDVRDNAPSQRARDNK